MQELLNEVAAATQQTNGSPQHTDVQMPHEAQVAIIRRVLAHIQAQTTDSISHSHQQPASSYSSAERYQKEREQIFRRQPLLIGHASLLDGPNSFITLEDHGVPIIVARDRDGTARALLNVCRHRGSKVTFAKSGSAKCFACPYHAWTYSQEGKLLHVPHKKGFPEVEPAKNGLVQLPLVEKYGCLWLCLDSAGDFDLDSHLGDLAPQIKGLNLQHHLVHERYEEVRNMNWKLLIDGFLEAYHIRSTHKKTFYGTVFDNLALHDSYGPHSRSIYPFKKIQSCEQMPAEQWKVRPVTSMIYHLFPNTLIAVEPYHVSLFQVVPLDAGRTLLRVTVLVSPEKLHRKDNVLKDIALLKEGLLEDYEIGESIQAGLSASANDFFHFGAYEGTLTHFHRSLDAALTAAARHAPARASGALARTWESRSLPCAV